MRRALLALAMTGTACSSPEGADEPLLAGRDLALADRIEFLGQRDGQPYRLERRADGGFNLTQPIRDALAPAWFATLRQTLATATLRRDDAAARTFPEPVAFLAAEFPAEFPPKFPAKLPAKPQGGPLRLDLAPAPGRADRLLARCGERIGTVALPVLHVLQPEQSALRDPRVFIAHDASAVRCRVADSAPISIERRDGVWQVVGNAPAADAAQLADAVLNLSGKPRYGPPPPVSAPAARLAVVTPHGEQTAELRRDGDRWLCTQQHRDLAAEVTLPAALRAVLDR